MFLQKVSRLKGEFILVAACSLWVNGCVSQGGSELSVEGKAQSDRLFADFQRFFAQSLESRGCSNPDLRPVEEQRREAVRPGVPPRVDRGYEMHCSFAPEAGKLSTLGAKVTYGEVGEGLAKLRTVTKPRHWPLPDRKIEVRVGQNTIDKCGEIRFLFVDESLGGLRLGTFLADWARLKLVEAGYPCVVVEDQAGRGPKGGVYSRLGFSLLVEEFRRGHRNIAPVHLKGMVAKKSKIFVPLSR